MLPGRHVLAVAGTHGKTDTTAMLAWILESAGLQPGFLVGGVPLDFGVSARLRRAAAPFVIEADEYDTAFFDKRSKFVHYRPRTAILNNLEFDHADIFDDLAAIERQFHHLVRTVPAQRPPGRQRARRGAAARARDGLLERACSASARSKEEPGMLRARGEPHAFDVLRGGLKIARVDWPLLGEHNQLNALAAIGAAEHVGVAPEVAARALARFAACGAGSSCAARSAASPSTTTSRTTRPRSRTTIDGLRRKVGSARILAVLRAALRTR